MPGQHIWHVKVRRFGQADCEIAEIRMDQWRAPVQGESIDVLAYRESIRTRENIRAKIVSFDTSPCDSKTRYTILATQEDDGNPPGYRVATEEDFEQ
jgi:hypothetical protein